MPNKPLWKHPVIWILAGLLAFSLYSHRQTSKEFTAACDAASIASQARADMLEDGLLIDVARDERGKHVLRDAESKLESICTDRRVDDHDDLR